MRAQTLRTVMLIRAIEETDTSGEVLPLSERAQANQAAIQEGKDLQHAFKGGVLSSRAQHVLAQRAETLCEYLHARFPVIDHVLDLTGGIALHSALVVGAAFLLGLALCLFGPSERFDIRGLTLGVLIVWNLAVYVVLFLRTVRPRPRIPVAANTVMPRESTAGPGLAAHDVTPRAAEYPAAQGLAQFYASYVRRRTDALIARSAEFNVPLAEGLRRFASEWGSVVQPLLVQRGKRLFHVSAACVAVGLMVGMYIRGVVLGHDPGWHSSFFGPDAIRLWLHMLYGPAAALTGVPLPDTTAAVEALRWDGVATRAESSDWVRLMAVTALLYIIVPRLIAALVASLALWGRALHRATPPSLVAYARGILLGAEGKPSADAADSRAAPTTPTPPHLG